MSSKFWEAAKKARQLNRVPSAIVNKRREEERKKRNQEILKLQKERFIQRFGYDPTAPPGTMTRLPNKMTPINIVQKPNGKLAAEVPKTPKRE